MQNKITLLTAIAFLSCAVYAADDESKALPSDDAVTNTKALMSQSKEAAIAIESLDLQIELQKKQNELLNEKLNHRVAANRLQMQDKELALSSAKIDKSINDTKSSYSGSTSINPNSLPLPPLIQTASAPSTIPTVEHQKETKKAPTDHGSIVVNDKTFKMID